MRIAPGLLAVEDFEDALDRESYTTRGLVPEDVEMWALFNHAGADMWAHRRCMGEFAPVPGQVVTVRKSGHGVRPVAELSIRDRVLYRALVRRWKDALPDPERSSEAHDAFLNAPLGIVTVPPYVVSSDVTACYEYIDHGLLAREVLARTGDSDGVEALTSLLAGLTGRSFGLPQQSGSSDVLAEAYLSVVERRLLRLGLAVWRYNDDFRIAVDSWSDALNAVDALDRECRAIGLALNDLKTVIRKGATYEKTLGRRVKVLKEISDEIEVDLTDVIQGAYDEIVVEPAKNEVIVAAAKKVVAEWLVLQEKMLAPDPKSTLTQKEQDKRLALTDLLRWALSVLRTAITDTEVLAACGQILRTEQTLTPLVARYLANATDSVATIAWFEEFLSGDPYLTPWQAWWIAPALRSFDGSYADGSAQHGWLESVWKDSSCPEPVKAGIAFTVAQKGLADTRSLMEVYESMTDTGRPFVARAVGAVASAADTGAATLLVEDEWVKWAFELGQSDA
jgi:RNA-directed DNA polymerase